MEENAHQPPLHRFPLADAESVSQATYVVVAEAKGCDPLDLPPIADAIEADALDALVSDVCATGTLRATFEYADHEITVTPEAVSVEAR